MRKKYFCVMISILVIEDNLEIRENTVELLEIKGYKVSAARNGRDGFVMAVNDCPDIIICDVSMPVIDGFGFLSLIKNENSTKNIPLIFFSAHTFSFMNILKKDDETYEYLKKPFETADLYSAIERCIQRRAGYSLSV